MKYILILITALFLSCSKEERCTPYNLVHESNYEEAKDKCGGYANSYPKMKVISSNPAGCMTPDEYKIARAKVESTTIKQFCNGVTYTIKFTLK